MRSLDPANSRAERGELQRMLLDGALRGDPRMERAFVEHFTPLIKHCARQLLRGQTTEQDIEDLVGEVWLSLFEDDKRRLRYFDPGRQVQLSTWIGAVTRHRCIDHLRRLQPTSPVAEDDLLDETPLPFDTIAGQERSNLARRAMAALSDEERSFLSQVCSDDIEASAIAAKFGISVSTVYTRRFKIAAKVAREVKRLLGAEALSHPCGAAA